MRYRVGTPDFSPKIQALASSMGLRPEPRPKWSVDAISVHSALCRDVEDIDKLEHLRLAQHSRRTIRKSPSYVRRLQSAEAARPLFLPLDFGIIELRDRRPYECDGEMYETVSFLVRARSVAEKPLLLEDVMHGMLNCAADIVFTNWLSERLASRYSGPGDFYVDEGPSFNELAELEIDGPVGKIDWFAVGHSLAKIFTPQFDAEAARLLREIERAHRRLQHVQFRPGRH